MPKSKTNPMKPEWAEAHNKKRREQYAQDPAYKTAVNRQNRSGYRKRKNADLRTAHENVGKEESFGTSRMIQRPEGVNGELTFTVKEIAALIGNYHPFVVYAWIREGKFPAPKLLRVNYKPTSNGAFVYGLTQAKQLLAIMAEHQKDKVYLYSTDTDTIAKLTKVA